MELLTVFQTDQLPLCVHIADFTQNYKETNVENYLIWEIDL